MSLKSNVSVNILGTEYFLEKKKIEDDSYLKKCDGYVDVTTKVIIVRDCRDFANDENSCDNYDEYEKKVARHEIVHAFFHESGLWSETGGLEQWGRNEELCDWIAIQSPKMFKAFKEAGCI